MDRKQVLKLDYIMKDMMQNITNGKLKGYHMKEGKIVKTYPDQDDEVKIKKEQSTEGMKSLDQIT